MADFTADRNSWLEILKQELAPTRGRMAGALRTTLALVITIVLLMILRIPAMAFGVFLIFLVSYETPYLNFRSGLIALCTQASGAMAGILLVSISGNSPLARVLGIALFAFIAAFVRVATVRFIMQPLDFAVFAIGSIECFDVNMRDTRAVSLALWPLGAGIIAVSTKVAVEYIFTRRNPYFDLYREIDSRFAALGQFFKLFGSGASNEQTPSPVDQVRRFAFMGQGKMHSLLQEIEERHKKDATRQIEPSSLPVLARLLDLTAAYTVHNQPSELSAEEKERLKRLARVMTALREAKWDEARKNLPVSAPPHKGELDPIEYCLMRFVAYYAEDRPLPVEAHIGDESVAAPSKRWLAADWLTNQEYAIFSFKVALCAMFCFVIFDALAWPGISTSVITVMVASLSSSGAMNQKLIFRFLGSTLGGVVLGLGCIVFVFPYTDSMVPFLLAAALATFIGAWVIRSPHYGYIGLQIAFSYYLVVFTGFSAPTHMAPARDRLIGILLALVVMMVAFRPEKSVDTMRETFARLLTLQAEYLKATAPHQPVSIRRRKAIELKSMMEVTVNSTRSFTELIAYEFSQHRDEHMLAAEKIEQAMLSSGDLLLSVSGWPQEPDSAENEEQVNRRRTALQAGLRSLAAVLKPDPYEKTEGVEAKLLDQAQDVPLPYLRNSTELYQELHARCREIAPC